MCVFSWPLLNMFLMGCQGMFCSSTGMFGSFRMTGSSSNYALSWLAAWRSAKKKRTGGNFKGNETCIVLDVTRPFLTEHVNMHDQSYERIHVAGLCYASTVSLHAR